MKFLKFSRIIPALAAMFGRAAVEDAKQATSSPVASFKISAGGGHNINMALPPLIKTHTPNGDYYAPRFQKKRRKNARRAWAAGDKFAFAKKH